jgi:hypothetical protein
MSPRVSPEEQPAAICVGLKELAARCAPNSRNGAVMECPFPERTRARTVPMFANDPKGDIG